MASIMGGFASFEMEILNFFLLLKTVGKSTAENVSVFEVFLVYVFPHSGWIRRETRYSILMRKNTDQKKLWIRIRFTQWILWYIKLKLKFLILTLVLVFFLEFFYLAMFKVNLKVYFCRSILGLTTRWKWCKYTLQQSIVYHVLKQDGDVI